MSFYLDPTLSISVEQIAGLVSRFEPVRRKEIEFGYVDEAVWIRLPVQNSGTEATLRYLLLETNWMTSIQAWLTSVGRHELILRQNQDMAFDTRSIPHQNLVARFTLAPEQGGVIWIRFISRGSSALPINIETELSFVQRSQFSVSKSMIFYALMLLFIVVAALSFFVFRNVIFPIYVCYATAVLAYVMHRDGFAFQYLWPSFPNFNAIASLPLGTGLGIFAILFSRQYLATKANHPRTDRALLVCMALLFLLVPYGLFIDEQGAKQIASIGVFLVAVTLLGLGIRSWIERGRQMIFFVAGWLGVVGASLTMILVSLLGVEISRESTVDAIRLAMVFDAVMMGFAMAERVLQIRRERDVALNQQLGVLQNNLDLHTRLNALESRYADAVEMAESSGKVLADATHDIRQPLFALRASLKSIKVEKNEEQVATAARSLMYLEQLVDEYLQKATSGGRLEEPPVVSGSGVPVSVVLTGIRDMFTVDAQSRGLQLRVRPSSVVTRANPMVVTRIISNYVANALRYTRSGGVLVGVRQHEGVPSIAVYDTGPGMDRASLNRVLQRAERGVTDADSGKGLGLDIAVSLAQQHGLTTRMESVPGKGSVFAVTLQPVGT